MDWGTLGVQNIITSISAAFIFGSLLVVFLQIRANNKVSRAQTYQSIANSANDFARFAISDPDILEFFKTWKYNKDNVKNLTEEQAKWVAYMAIDFWENLFYQHEQGMLPEPLWEDHWRKSIEYSVGLEGFDSYWKPVKSRYYKEFVKFVDSAR